MSVVKPNGGGSGNSVNNQTSGTLIAPERNLAKLGDYVFSYKNGAFDSLSRSTKYNFAELERAQAPTLLQKTGGVEEEISLRVEFVMRKLSAFDSFRKAAAKRNPMSLTLGTGEYLGEFAVTDINEERSVLFADGAHRKLSIGLTLKRIYQ
jgi:phage protein U